MTFISARERTLSLSDVKAVGIIREKYTKVDYNCPKVKKEIFLN